MNRTVKLMIENSVYGCPTAKEAFMNLVTIDTERQKILWDKIKWRVDNRYWLKYSVKIAIKILRKIMLMKISKEELAIKSNISNDRMIEILKGQADLSLSEIGKIEQVLKIKLK